MAHYSTALRFDRKRIYVMGFNLIIDSEEYNLDASFLFSRHEQNTSWPEFAAW